MAPVFAAALCVLLAAGAALPAEASAQAPDTSLIRRRFTAELRGGFGVGAFERTSAGLEFVPEPAFELTAAYGVLPVLAVYAGYGRIAFGCEASFCTGAGLRLVSSGIGVGLRLDLPATAGPWVRLGLTHHRLEIDGRAGGDPYHAASGRGVGIDARAGVTFRIGPRFLLTPGVGFTRYRADFGDPGGHDGVALLVGDVGVRVAF